MNLNADDTTIYTSNEDPSSVGQQLEEDLGVIAGWINANSLKMNVAKTQLMVLCGKSRQESAQSVHVRICDRELPKKESVKYLGVKIDNTLNWKLHLDDVRKKCLAKIAMIRRAGACLPHNVRKMLYQLFVLPHLDYCLVVWHTCGATLTKRVERVQNCAMRMILQKPLRTRSNDLRTKLNMITLEQRRQINMTCLVHRCLLSQAHSYVSSKFVTNSTFGYTNTRGRNKIHLKRPLSDFYQSTFEFQGSKLFNDLPENIREIGNTRALRLALKKLP